jgi:hypothetical protein
MYMAQCCEKVSITDEEWVSNRDHEIAKTQLKMGREETWKAYEGDEENEEAFRK